MFCLWEENVIITAADEISKYIFHFSKRISLNIECEQAGDSHEMPRRIFSENKAKYFTRSAKILPKGLTKKHNYLSLTFL